VVGVSVLLSALAVWLAIWAAWEIETTYARFRGRTDLDMPDWFTINLSLMTTVLTLGTLAGFCQFVAGGLFFTWAGRVGWTMRIGFVAQWLGSSALLVVLLRPWLR
jgi:hypothetical protein